MSGLRGQHAGDLYALSLTQPWATLVAIGAKRLETRSWSTSYRGRIAIHASKGFPTEARRLVRIDPFARALRQGGHRECMVDDLPRGAILATVDLVDVQPIHGHGLPAAWREELNPTGEFESDLDEVAFGDYRSGRFAWRLENVRKLVDPVPVKGRLGVWWVDTSTARKVLG